MGVSNLKVGDKVRTTKPAAGGYYAFSSGLEGKVIRININGPDDKEPLYMISFPDHPEGLAFFHEEVLTGLEKIEEPKFYGEGDYAGPESLKEKKEPESYGTTFFESEDSATRKQYPIYSGVLKYFPKTMAALAHCSWKGNEQHNPGEPLHWAREKSTDHEDCMIRHLLQKGTVDSDGISHSVKVVWRAAAMCELELEGNDDTEN